MKAHGWLPAAVLAPIGTIAAAATLFLLVALLIALQPPEAPDAAGAFGHALAWAQAVLFAGAAVLLFAGFLLFARPRTAPHEAHDTAGMGVGRGVVVSDPGPPPAAAARPRPPSALLAAAPVQATPVLPVRPRSPHAPGAEPGGRTRYTLIALGADEEDTRAIADFDDADALIAAVHRWRTRSPDERLVIFGPDGARLAHRAVSRPAAAAARREHLPRPRPRPGLAARGAL
jgi:hypothetical protein